MFVRAGVPSFFGSTEVPSYLYVGHGWSGVHAWEQVWWVGQAVLWVLVDVVLIARLWRATPGARRRLLPLYSLVVLLFTFVFVYHAIHVAQDQTMGRLVRFLLGGNLWNLGGRGGIRVVACASRACVGVGSGGRVGGGGARSGA